MELEDVWSRERDALQDLHLSQIKDFDDRVHDVLIPPSHPKKKKKRKKSVSLQKKKKKSGEAQAFENIHM